MSSRGAYEDGVHADRQTPGCRGLADMLTRGGSGATRQRGLCLGIDGAGSPGVQGSVL